MCWQAGFKRYGMSSTSEQFWLGMVAHASIVFIYADSEKWYTLKWRLTRGSFLCSEFYYNIHLTTHGPCTYFVIQEFYEGVENLNRFNLCFPCYCSDVILDTSSMKNEYAQNILGACSTCTFVLVTTKMFFINHRPGGGNKIPRTSYATINLRKTRQCNSHVIFVTLI